MKVRVQIHTIKLDVSYIHSIAPRIASYYRLVCSFSNHRGRIVLRTTGYIRD